jgi:tRNA-binding protein
MISWDNFAKIDIRCGTIVEVKDFPNARNPAYRLTVDFGALGLKETSAQITKHYTKEALQDKQVLAVVNFPKETDCKLFLANAWSLECTMRITT